MAKPDDLAPYKYLFLKHLAFVRSHSTGSTEGCLVSSIFPPNAFWSSQEKSRFFHGITRYSRLRPDLIAAHVGGGKTVADVVGYMEVLEEGSKHQGETTRRRAEPARVVSDKWIKYEERMATKLREQEEAWRVEKRDMEREELMNKIKPKKKRRKRNSESEEEDPRIKSWKREDAMECLGRHELTFLDSLIRKELGQVQADLRASSAPFEGSSQNASIRANSQSQKEMRVIMTSVERRRLQKRLHMRRRRAEMAGVEVNEDEGRLKPGRKTTRSQPFDSARSGSKITPLSSPSKTQNSLCTDKECTGTDGDGDIQYKPRGLTASQGTRQALMELNIDINYVHTQELDLFNLSKFGTLWSVLVDEEQIDSISSATIRLLRACLDCFLHRLIEKTITIAEAEKAMKRGTKVWHLQAENIKVSHVSQALEIMGVPQYKSKSFVLERREVELEGGYFDSSNDISVFRDIFSPLIYHPQLFEKPEAPMDENMVFTEGDRRKDEMEELANDMKLEEIDERMDRRHERSLWKLMGGESDRKGYESMEGNEGYTSKSDEETTAPLGRRYYDSLRLRPAGGEVKSQPFILSDDEAKAEMSE